MTTFDKDLFISYAHIDNLPLTANEEGWISRFHVSLNALLSMRLGKRARIWRDDKLQGNDVFADEIVDQFGRTAVLLSVLSPRYLKSRWCTREVTEFCARAEAGGGIVVSNKARVFKVLKTPVASEEPLPPLMKSLLGYEFFTLEDGTPMELDARYGDKYAQDFNRKVNKLAYEIAQLLDALEDAGTSDAVSESVPLGGSATATPTEVDLGRTAGSCIYLAECSFDLKEDRERLQTELTRLGHTVMPDRHLPRDEAGYVAEVEALLARAELAIHPIGAYGGAVPDGPGRTPVPELQNELAAARSDAHGLERLIWLPHGTGAEGARQRAFVARLQEDDSAQRGADLVAGSMESLKRAVFDVLERKRQTPEASLHEPAPAEDGSSLVHLLCTSDDRKGTVPLRRFLRTRGIEVTLPAFEGEAAEVRAANQRLLARCDAVILYYGRGDEAWKRTIDTELKKLPVFRTRGDLPPVHTYLAAPGSHDKDDLIDMGEVNLVDGLDGLVEARMSAILESVGAAAVAV